MTIETPEQLRSFLDIMREYGVEEASLGDLQVRFSRSAPPDAVANPPAPEPPKTRAEARENYYREAGL